MSAYDGVNPDINLELLSQIALNGRCTELEEKSDSEEILSFLIDQNDVPEVVDLPLVLPVDNAGDGKPKVLCERPLNDNINTNSTVEDPLWSSTMLSSPTFKTVDWNSQINDIFALTPAKPKPKTSKKKCTSHRLLTPESFIAENDLKSKKRKKNF